MAEVDGSSSGMMMMIDEIYEFSAPRFFDFVRGETDQDARKAELWFDTALAYAPSPFMPKIKAGRSVTVESLCDFSEADNTQKTLELSSSSSEVVHSAGTSCASKADMKNEEVTPSEIIDDNNTSLVNGISADKETCKAGQGEDVACTQQVSFDRISSSHVNTELTDSKDKSISSVQIGTKDCCTPNAPVTARKGDLVTNANKQQSARKMPSLIRNPSALAPKNRLQSSQAKGVKASSVRRDTNAKTTAGSPSLAQENQAIKRQKLDGGRSRQVLNVKPQNLLHKSKLGLSNGSSNLCTVVSDKASKENRKVYVREPAAAFVSTAEMMRKFQSSTRDLSLPKPNSSLSHVKPKLTLTRPKEPDFETSQRVRSVKVKSTAELEEEMMAKIPKFKARPLNKKILKAPTLPALPKSVPQPPQFQEFHLETMERANQNAESASVASTEKSHQQHNQWKPCLTNPKTPVLHTSQRARPLHVKSSSELELEELEKIPKFKARPLNKKIFESKGGLGIFCNEKKQITKPQEFHFATNERIPLPAATVVDSFDKLSLNSEPCHANQMPRNTRPNPFHLHTEERGAEKERKFVTEVMQKQWEEEQARIHKANPYPYTTDYPVIPPKPEPKQPTKPEPFQLESLVRHEEELQREMEERRRMEKEEAQRRRFKAQPVLKEDPIPVPEKVRRPLTQVENFNLHVDHRAVDRAEFDKKIKEKQMMYKRYREESEAARMMEEEKALKQLRRTLVPHARPMPKFSQPFLPQKSSKEVTEPKSPKLKVLERRERRRFVSAATSTAAAKMR